jgi:response regulator NasT
MAVGVLMHRYSLPRDEALARLMSLASADGHSLPEQARRIVDAVELLARPGQAG